MRFLLTLMMACAWLPVQVIAFSDVGAYERAFLYYLYLSEIDVYGKAKSVTPPCGRVMATGGKPCSYDQWVNYVQGQEKKQTPFQHITKEPYEKGVYPDLDKLTTMTSKAGQTGVLEPGRVIEGFKADGNDAQKYSAFLQKAAEMFQRLSYDERFSKVMRANGASSLRAIMILRMSASVETFQKKEAGESRTVKVYERFYDPKHEDWGKVKDFDQKAYLAENPGSTGKILKQRWNTVFDAGHSGNIASIKAVWEEMLSGC